MARVNTITFEWNRDYGIAHKQGWSIAANGHYYIEFGGFIRAFLLLLILMFRRRER